MHKILIVLLAFVLLLAACNTRPAENTTETAEALQPGLNTTPSGFVGFGSTEPTDAYTRPDDGIATPTDPKPTEPQPTEPQPTEPTVVQPTEPQPTEPQPTEPDATEPDGVSIAPDAEGFIQYRNMSASQQYEFFKEFGGDPVAFDAWLDTAEAAFKVKYPDVEYDGSGPIILPEG